MSNFFTLTKVFFLSGFNVNKKKQNQSSSIKTFLLFGLLFLVISFIYNGMYMSISDTAYGLDKTEYLLIVLVADAMLVFVTTLMEMQKTIFKTKDYEFLESLPVSKFGIVSAKIASVYLIGLFEDLIITVPALVFYLIFKQSVYVALLVFISSFFVAIIPLLFSSLLGAVISLLTAKMKNQNIFTILFYILFLGGVMFFSFSMSGGNITGVQGIKNVLPYFRLLEMGFDSSKWYFFLLFILIHVVSFVLVVLFISAIYQPINAYLGNYKIHEEYVAGKDKENYSVEKMLMKKERQMLLKNPQYLLNSVAGYIGYLFIAIMFLIMPIMFQSENGTPEEKATYIKVFMSLVPAFGLTMVSISSTSTVSVSLEGKNGIELILSCPLDPKLVLKTKLKLAITLSVSFSILTGIIAAVLGSILYGFDLGYCLSVIIIPTLGSVFVSIIGLLDNLKWPKLDFENEMQVVKNSASVNFTMLFCAVPALLVGITGSVITIFSGNSYISLAIMSFIYILFIFIFAMFLKQSGEKMFYKLLNK